MFNLVRTLNTALGNNGLDSRVLEQVFNTYWEQFKREFDEIIKTTKEESSAKPREQGDVLAEILENTRALSSRIARLEDESRRQKTQERIKKLKESLKNSSSSSIKNQKIKDLWEENISKDDGFNEYLIKYLNNKPNEE